MPNQRSNGHHSVSVVAAVANAAVVTLVLQALASCGGNASEGTPNSSSAPNGEPGNNQQEANDAASGTGAKRGLTKGAECAADAACASGFCDLGSCAIPNPEGSYELYGHACGPMPPFGPSGLAGWGGKPPVISECDHLCLDGFCRSCSSDAQCYELTGYPSCAVRPGDPGRSCSEGPNPTEDLFHPPGAIVRAGTPLAPVAQTMGVPSSVRLALEGPLEGAVNARLAVVWWHQRAGEFDEFLQVAYDTPLAFGATELEIAFSDVALPYEENLVCWRECRDRAQCPCRGFEFAL